MDMMGSINTLCVSLKNFAKNKKASIREDSIIVNAQESALNTFLSESDSALSAYWKDHDFIPGFEIQNIDQKAPLIPKTQIQSISANNEFNITILNGRFHKQFSNLPKNINITELCDLSDKAINEVFDAELIKPTKMTLINTALVKNGFLLEAKECSQHRTIYINYLNYSDVSCFNQMRNVYIFEKNAQLSIVEQFFNSEDQPPQLNNVVSELKLEDDAKVKMCSFNGASRGLKSKNINNTFVHQKKHSSFELFNIYTDVNWIKHSVNIVLAETQSNCNLQSISLLDQEQSVNSDLYVCHQAPSCVSKQVYKGIFDDRSKGVFNSCVLVSKNAQNTIATQQNNNIILSDYAVSKSNPQLEIFADEVECAHGSTVGKIDEAALFYLRSRGINKVLAHSLLLRAFLNDVVESVANNDVKKLVLLILDKKLNIIN